MLERFKVVPKIFDEVGINSEGMFDVGSYGERLIQTAIEYVQRHQMRPGAQRDLTIATKAFYAGLKTGIERTIDEANRQAETAE